VAKFRSSFQNGPISLQLGKVYTEQCLIFWWSLSQLNQVIASARGKQVVLNFCQIKWMCHLKNKIRLLYSN